jgi:uncharacterized RDD family membrane protein YckC
MITGQSNRFSASVAMPDMTCTNHPEAEGSIVRCSRCLRPFCGDCLIRLNGRPFCGDCKVEQVMDVHSGVSDTQLELATIGRRWAALIIDRIILFTPLIALVIVGSVMTDTSKNNDFPAAILLLIGLWVIAALLYEPLLLTRSGQTWGKQAVGVRVVRNDGTPISAGQAWGRSLGRLAIMMVSSLIDYLPAFFTKEKQTVHDMMAGTRVIRTI